MTKAIGQRIQQALLVAFEIVQVQHPPAPFKVVIQIDRRLACVFELLEAIDLLVRHFRRPSLAAILLRAYLNRSLA